MSILIALALQPAHAWDHIELVWFSDQIPVEWWMDDDVEDSLPEGYQLDVIQVSMDGWEDAACAHVDDAYQGTDDIGSRSSASPNGIYWDDPGDEMEPGVLGEMSPAGDRDVQTVNGIVYTRFKDADITFNNDVDWGTTEEIALGNCGGQTAIEGVATHEVGHWFGMGHSCEEGDLCPEQIKLDATMFWQVGPCDLAQNDINQDDVDGITALYGPFGTFQVKQGYSRSGGVQREVCFEISSDQEILSTEWNFGDGSEPATDAEPCHTFEDAGQYTVTVAFELEDEVCGGFNTSASELGYVLACNPPAPEEGAEGFFTMEPVEGLTWQTLNHADVSVYGCIDTIEWQVYKGTTDADISEDNLVDLNGEDAEGVGIGAWSPKITFPEEGDYVVLLNVGGPGGVTGAWVPVTVENVKAEGEGCAVVPAGASALGVLVAAAAAARRRRNA